MVLFGFYNKITRRAAGKLVRHAEVLIPLQKDLQLWGLEQQFGVLRVRIGRSRNGEVYSVSEPADVPPPADKRLKKAQDKLKITAAKAAQNKEQ